MAKQLLWINKDTSGNLTNSSRAQRSEVQSAVQRGRPRTRKKVKPDPPPVPSPVSACSPDPFNTSSVELDVTAHGLLRYYVYYAHPSQWPNEKPVLGGSYAFKDSISRIMGIAMQDSLMMYCLLSAMASRLQFVDHFSFPNVARKEGRYSYEALRLMQARIEETAPPVEEGNLRVFLQCIGFLASAEAYRGDFVASRMHMNATMKLLDDRIGGIEFLEERHLQGQLLMADLFLGCVELKPCVCEPFYDPGPAIVLELQPYELRECTENDMGAAWSDIHMPEELRGLVSQILESYRIRMSLFPEIMTSSRALETNHWVTKRNMAIRNRLLSFEPREVHFNALRTTLIMWTLLSMNFTGRVRTVKVMATKLREILEEEENDTAVRLWILLVGFACSSQESPLSEWFAEQIRRAEALQPIMADAKDSGRNLADTLESFQRLYLYHEPVQGLVTERLALMLQSG